MSGSEYGNSTSNEQSDATGQGKPPLRKDEVAIIEEKLEQWMGADATKRKSIFKDIAHSIQHLDANKTLKSHHWVTKKKVSVSQSCKCQLIIDFCRPSRTGCTTTVGLKRKSSWSNMVVGGMPDGYSKTSTRTK